MSRLTGKPPAKLQPGTPYDRVAVPDAPDPRGPGELGRYGSGRAIEVKDRVLPTELDPECMQSAMRGVRGKGLNKETMNESLDDLNQGGGGLSGDVDRTWGE